VLTATHSFPTGRGAAVSNSALPAVVEGDAVSLATLNACDAAVIAPAVAAAGFPAAASSWPLPTLYDRLRDLAEKSVQAHNAALEALESAILSPDAERLHVKIPLSMLTSSHYVVNVAALDFFLHIVARAPAEGFTAVPVVQARLATELVAGAHYVTDVAIAFPEVTFVVASHDATNGLRACVGVPTSAIS